MAILTTQTITRAGIAPTFAAAAAGGDKIKPGERTFLYVKNGHTSSQSVTIVTPGDVEGAAIADIVVSVPNAGERMIGPITDRLFRNPVDGYADVTYSGVTALTLAVIQV